MTPRERELIVRALRVYSEVHGIMTNNIATLHRHRTELEIERGELITLAHRIESGQWEPMENTPRGYDIIPNEPLSAFNNSPENGGLDYNDE